MFQLATGLVCRARRARGLLSLRAPEPRRALGIVSSLSDEDWLPLGISEHALEHWNLLIALAQTDWQLGGEQMRTTQQALDEYAGIVVFEDAEHGDKAPLRVQFGHYSTSPVFVTDCYYIADVWTALGLSFPAARCW